MGQSGLEFLGGLYSAFASCNRLAHNAIFCPVFFQKLVGQSGLEFLGGLYSAFASCNRSVSTISLLPPVFFENLVGQSGLEPPTSRLSVVCSNQLSYWPTVGGDNRDRTDDPLLAKQVLSQLSYTPIYNFQGTRDRPCKLNNEFGP